MTYQNWGCDPLAEECESCLNALCNACVEQFRKNRGTNEPPDGLENICEDSEEPDCDNCDLEKKPRCSACEIILGVCRNCNDHETCDFRIC
ncbi:hypothetical protein [uncultured Methanoregula sp.]|uniref:hypothetical protein n=1 Tax=uncultured Methanoregula sp. TaxID=1005933 RepID=UPI002AAB33ED|nr:hypothetical protein [uncultured Methanoregula sp.]